MRDPEDLMPAMDGLDPETKEPSPDGVRGTSGGPDTAAERGRTDVDAFGSDPDVRFPGETEDPAMTTSDAAAEVVRGEGLGEDTGALAFDEQEGPA